MKRITIKFSDNSGSDLNIKEIPDVCPICHKGIDPIPLYGFCDRDKWTSNECLQIVYRCTMNDCRSLFIAYYKSQTANCNGFSRTYSKPVKQTKRKFSEAIMTISEDFCVIYNQAFEAEQMGLTEICGVGYRKALEFLIKDYAIVEHPKSEDEIKKSRLASCISSYITDENIKNMAKRAVWLGNDETHYEKDGRTRSSRI